MMQSEKTCLPDTEETKSRREKTGTETGRDSRQFFFFGYTLLATQATSFHTPSKEKKKNNKHKTPSIQAPKHPSTTTFYSRVFYSRKNNAFTPSQTIAPTHATLINSRQLLPTAPFLAFHAHLKNDLALSNQSHDLDGMGKV